MPSFHSSSTIQSDYLQPPITGESYMVYENAGRESIGASNTHQETPLEGSGVDYGTHQNEDVQEINNQVTSKAAEKVKWTQYNDEDLCMSWLNFTSDSIRGIDQSKADYWKKIVDYYNQWKREGPAVTVEQASNHWYKMCADVSKFNGCYIQVKNTDPSGHDEEQIISKAQQLYTSQSQNKKRKFPYIHSWKILRKAPKWKNYVSSQSVLDERPVGQKAAKADVKNKGKKKKNTHIDEKWSDYQDIQVKRLALAEEHIRQQDFMILCKDTTNMDERARKNHEQVCSIIRDKYGMS
ncbi:Glutathione S-transferase T3 [Bienertia sinuspersici]